MMIRQQAKPNQEEYLKKFDWVVNNYLERGYKEVLYGWYPSSNTLKYIHFTLGNPLYDILVELYEDDIMIEDVIFLDAVVLEERDIDGETGKDKGVFNREYFY